MLLVLHSKPHLRCGVRVSNFKLFVSNEGRDVSPLVLPLFSMSAKSAVKAVDYPSLDTILLLDPHIVDALDLPASRAEHELGMAGSKWQHSMATLPFDVRFAFGSTMDQARAPSGRYERQHLNETAALQSKTASHGPTKCRMELILRVQESALRDLQKRSTAIENFFVRSGEA